MSAGGILLVIVLGVFVLVIATSLYNSPKSVARRTAEWARQYAAELQSETEAQLRDRIAKSDYWDLTADSALRDTDAARDLLSKLEAGQYAEILDELGNGEYMCSIFAGVERSIGYRSRPMIMDYDGLFVPVLLELRNRQRGAS